MEVSSQYIMFQLVSTCAGQKVVILVQWETLSAGNVAANEVESAQYCLAVY